MVDRLRTLKEIAAAQSRIAAALAGELRAQKPWQEALRSEARGKGVRGWLQRWKPKRRRSPHAELTDQLASLQRHARELAMWAERIQVELGALEEDRERLLAQEQGVRLASKASAAQVAARKREVAALHAEMDALPTRLDPRYADLEAKAQALLEEPSERAKGGVAELELRQALTANRELQEALTRAQKVVRRLELAAQEGVERVDRALAANAATAGARELSRAVAAAVEEQDPDSMEQLAHETERILSDALARLPTARRPR
jgi:hypothetical protein